MTDFSKIELIRTPVERKGPYIKIRRERCGAPDQEFWLAVDDEIMINTGNREMPYLCFTILEVKL